MTKKAMKSKKNYRQKDTEEKKGKKAYRLRQQQQEEHKVELKQYANK